MSGLIAAMQNIDALAFLVLGAAIAAGWLRSREASTAYLALAIGLLCLVFALGQVPTLLHVKVPLLSELDLACAQCQDQNSQPTNDCGRRIGADLG